MEGRWDHGPIQHQCFLEYQVCLFFCYRSTSFSNNPFSYLSLNKYVFQANPVLFEIIVYWCQINMHMHTSGLHLSTTHKSTLTIPTAHSFSSKCSSTAPSPAKYSYLPFHVSISTWAATGQAVSRNWYPWKLLSGKKKGNFKTGWAPSQLPQQPVVTSRCRTALSGLVTHKKHSQKASPWFRERWIGSNSMKKMYPPENTDKELYCESTPKGPTRNLFLLEKASCSREFKRS